MSDRPMITGTLERSRLHPSGDGSFLIEIRTTEPADSLTMHNGVSLVGVACRHGKTERHLIPFRKWCNGAALGEPT